MADDARTNALKHAWWIERDAIAIVKNSATDTTTNHVSVSEAKQINVHAVKLDDDLVAAGSGTDMTESPNIPAEFHDALANYAIAKGYELKPELVKMAGYFRSLFNDDVREGKRYANKGRDGTAYSIQPVDY